MHFPHTPWRAWLACAAALLAGAAAAQTPPAELTYRPALQDYQRYAPAPVASWPQANQTVHERGGWRTYARETAAAPAPNTPASPAPSGHAHHHAMPATEGGPAR